MDRDRKAVISWWFYDWANSAFILTVVAGFFPVFFKSYWCTGVDATMSTARLGIGNSIAGLLVALMSPLLGAVADAGRAKKLLLGMFVVLGAVSTMGLFIMPKGEWIGALTIFLVASVGFNSANIFYDALLVDVTEKSRMDWVSSVGYGIGYLGCGLLFLVNTLMVSAPSRFGLSGPAQAIKVSFLMAAIWWLVFSLPLFFNVHEKRERKATRAIDAIRLGAGHILSTVGAIVRNRPLLLFLLAYWLYIDGVHTFVLMAVDFGMAIGIEPASLMKALLLVQFVGFPSALLFGKLAGKFGATRMIMVGIAIYIGVCGVGSLLLRTATHYIILAGITGIAQGGIQALSRSCFGKLIPAEAAGEYFGFYNIISRFAVILGPVVVGVVALATKKAGFPSLMASRVGMSSVSLLFIGGLVLLGIVDRVCVRSAA